MVRYWARIRERYPDLPIAQYMLVLGDHVSVPEQYVDCGVTCTWTVVRVEELDPAELLRRPTTAAIAALARGTSAQRTEVLTAAIERIRAGTDPDRGQSLMAAAVTLASVVLPRSIIDLVVEEAAMPVLMRDTPYGREIFDEGRDAGRNEGRHEGRREGVQEGRRSVLGALLRQRFGDGPGVEEVVEQLAALPDDEGLARLAAADTLRDLSS